MKRINKKGFTLIEMLGAVAILGIIATIGIVSVSKVIKSAHNKFDYTQYDSFMQAAETYFSDNKSRLPLTPMDWKEITLQELINKKYIEKMLDSNKQEFDYARSKVVVTRLTSGKYKYEAILYRKKGSPIGKISNKVTNQNSNITFRLRDKNKYHKENKTYYVRDYPVVDIGISDTDQLSGYQYIIYRNGKQFKKSENIEISGGLSVKEAVTLGKEFPFGKYSIKVVAYDKSGNKTTNSTDNSGLGDDAFSIYIDRIKPNCAIQIDGKIGDNGWYKEKDISLTLKESDKESGLLKHDMQTSKNFPNLGTLNTLTTLVKKQSDTGSTTWYAHVEDKAGNVCETEVNVKVDTKKPRCEVVSNSSSEAINTSKWYNKYTANKIEQLKLNHSDEGPSGVNRHILEMNTSNLSTTYKSHNDNDYINTQEGEHNYNGYVRDNAGNDVNCSTFIKKDTIDPECPATYYVQYFSYNIPNVFISPDITFTWKNFSYDTVYADAYVQEVGTPYKYDYGRFPGGFYGQAIYTIAGKVGFTGSYSTEIVAYDQAENDKHCYGSPTEPAQEPEPVLPEKCSQEDGKYYDEYSNEVSEEEWRESCFKEEEEEDDDEPLTFKCTSIRNHYYDKDGNEVSEEEYIKSCNINVDLKCPKINDGNADPSKWANKTVTLTFSGFGSGVKKYEWWTSNDGGDHYTLKSDNNDPATVKSKTLEAEGIRKGKLVLIGGDGSKQECETSTYKIDKTAPKCNGVSYDSPGVSGCTLGLDSGMKWYKASGAVEVTAKCKDENGGSGCQSTTDNSRTVTFHTSSSEYSDFEGIINKEVTIRDKAGNTKRCGVSLALDRKPPRVSSWGRARGSAECGHPPTTFPHVVYPHISDGGSGYLKGNFVWIGGSNPNAGPGSKSDAKASSRECIGSSTGLSSQRIEYFLTDCVGNKSDPKSKKGFDSVNTE